MLFHLYQSTKARKSWVRGSFSNANTTTNDSWTQCCALQCSRQAPSLSHSYLRIIRTISISSCSQLKVKQVLATFTKSRHWQVRLKSKKEQKQLSFASNYRNLHLNTKESHNILLNAANLSFQRRMSSPMTTTPSELKWITLQSLWSWQISHRLTNSTAGFLTWLSVMEITQFVRVSLWTRASLHGSNTWERNQTLTRKLTGSVKNRLLATMRKGLICSNVKKNSSVARM